MSIWSRRNFLSLGPLASVGTAMSLLPMGARWRSQTPTAPTPPPRLPIGKPTYVARRRSPTSSEPGGLILKIAGMAVVRLKNKRARVYFVDYARTNTRPHLAQLFVPRAALLASSKQPDAITHDLAIYRLQDRITVEGTPMDLDVTEGSIVQACPTGILPAGIRSFLQLRQGLGWSYTPATDDTLETRSVAWLDLNRGRLEHPDDVKVGDPGDTTTTITDGTNKRSQAVRQVIYYGLPKTEVITIRDGRETIKIDCNNYQVVAGVGFAPIEHSGHTMFPYDLTDAAMLSLIDESGAAKGALTVNRCGLILHPDCECCPPIIEEM